VNRLSRNLIACVAIAVPALPAAAAPANTLRELSAELDACALQQGIDANAELTIVFMLNRRGEVIGKPRISHSRLPDDPAARGRIVANVARAIDQCLPLPITDGLGGAIAGRPLAIRLMGPTRKATNT
jgi:hypothetical protein